jgi:cobalamin biosynthesis protein CobT
LSHKGYRKKCKELEKIGAPLKSHSPDYNSDAEAIKFVRERILKQIGKKIVIHLSDGNPVPCMDIYESPINPGYSQWDFDLKKEVQITLNCGIELYSIGIMSDGVNSYYPPRRTCVIQKVDQLYPHIIKLIRSNLKRG